VATSAEIRRQFIDFFVERHGHVFAPSSPVVPHDDPTLLFTNAGMNQFKPIFLGQADPGSKMGLLTRAANSQKCIRAGGKHNDLEDVGKDLYHHTFFEMLGNWSFGDYFKAEAIQWAFELLVDAWGLDSERLYATYFQGSKEEGLDPDRESYELWQRHLPARRILPGDMKDNFWEMGDTGPCGPCSELHYDGRSDAERAQTPGDGLVNRDHPDVIEVWNLVFIQFDRRGPGAAGLHALPAKHVDTGMGLERITRILQGKQSNYDTDLFTPLFERIREVTGAEAYGGELENARDVAYRVIADHVRALTFAITDGAEPSSEGRGYVLRRILRRAVRHGRQTLGAQGTFLHEIVPTVVEEMGGFFPELKKDPERVRGIIKDEEEAFGRTLDRGIQLFMSFVAVNLGSSYAAEQAQRPEHQRRDWIGGGRLSQSEREQLHEEGRPRIPSTSTIRIVDAQGQVVDEVSLSRIDKAFVQRHFEETPSIAAEEAFKLHDTYGFPIDLTEVMAEERGMTVDVAGFEKLMEEAREKARAGGSAGEAEHPAATLPGDAVARLNALHIRPTDDSFKFDLKPIQATVKAIWNGRDFDENKHAAHMKLDDRIAVVLDKTNCYAEMGGQVGDTGRMTVSREARTSTRDAKTGGEFVIEDTRMFGGYVAHIGRVKSGEIRVGDAVRVKVEPVRRQAIMANHTATHLLNFALREAAGPSVDQKGSLVAPDRLRFDFTRGGALTGEEINRVESIVREQIEEDLPVSWDTAPLELARRINGVRAVFGETYPDPVRVVSIGAPVSALVQSPEDEAWRDLSVEFCGGTHLERTGEAEAFAIVEESAVAKGVRRVVGLTGQDAKLAIERGKALLERAQQAASLTDDRIEREVADIAAELEGQAIPVVLRRRVAAALEALQDRVKRAAKAAAAAGRASAVDSARELAERVSGEVIIEALPDAGTDRQALLSAMDAVRSKHEGSAVMLLGADPLEGKVVIVANVPKGLIDRGLKAGDWVRAAAEACGGKGGGRPDSAQGGGTDPAKVGAAVDSARKFAAEKLG